VYEVEKPGYSVYRAGLTVPAPSLGAAIQINLSPITVFKIRGKLQGFEAPEAVNFELLGRGGGTGAKRVMFNTSSGEFEVLDVTPGEYSLRAAEENKRGEASVKVGSADVNGVSITLLSVAKVSGVMRSVGGRADALRPDNPCNVNLSQSWLPGAIYVPKWQRESKFSLDDVIPGTYQVRFLCFGAYIQSAFFGGADLVRNPILTIPADVPPPSLEINYTFGGGSLQATIKNPVLPFDAVLLVPAFPEANGPELQQVHRFLGTMPDQDMFQFSNLAPGDYTIYTFPKFEDVKLRDPAFLQRLTGGATVHIEDGKIAELSMTGTSVVALHYRDF
jgi:hypothetical protein